MNLIKKLLKTALTFTALTYALCLFGGESVSQYAKMEQGGLVSVAYQYFENTANTIKETYSRAEEQADEWLPQKVKAAINRISKLLTP